MYICIYDDDGDDLKGKWLVELDCIAPLLQPSLTGMDYWMPCHYFLLHPSIVAAYYCTAASMNA
jgi:hypothetical protein